METAGERMGIGLIDFSIDRDPTGAARIVTPIFGTPSPELGVRPGDPSDMNHSRVVGQAHNAQRVDYSPRSRAVGASARSFRTEIKPKPAIARGALQR